MLILKDELVSFRRCFHRIQLCRPRACLLGAIRCYFILNADQFQRQIIEVLHRMWALRRGPVHKRHLWLHLKLARVEENFSVSVSVDCVARLLGVERTGPTVHMAWLFAEWCACYFQRSGIVI